MFTCHCSVNFEERLKSLRLRTLPCSLKGFSVAINQFFHIHFRNCIMLSCLFFLFFFLGFFVIFLKLASDHHYPVLQRILFCLLCFDFFLFREFLICFFKISPPTCDCQATSSSPVQMSIDHSICKVDSTGHQNHRASF